MKDCKTEELKKMQEWDGVKSDVGAEYGPDTNQ
jgi:hypothetical protein